jgi:glycosyltransferase involved in cell wall biosynthesis
LALQSTICFPSYELHPTTSGGAGVLIHHAAELLLREGHRVVFLLEMPFEQYAQFMERDRLGFTNAERCTAYHVDSLCTDLPYELNEVSSWAVWQALRFSHALAAVFRREQIDFAELFDFCGVGYYAMVQRLYGDGSASPVLGVRLHSSIELIDRYGAIRGFSRERHRLYGLERGQLRLAEAILTPTRTYYEGYYRQGYGLESDKVIVSQPPKLPLPRVRLRPDRGRPFSILYFGRLMQAKGVDQLVHAALALFERHPELPAMLELVGPDSSEGPFAGSYAEYLRSLMPSALRGRLVFRGPLSHRDSLQLFERVLFAVFPNRLESFCYSLHDVYDAGVPVIVNDLPAFGDFFHHGQNALVYDGTTRGLLESMEFLLFNDESRERLVRPYAVAQEPLGDYYGRPVALSPLRVTTTTAAPSIHGLIVVLTRAERESTRVTLDALLAQTDRGFDLVCLDESEERDGEMLWWLGTAWRVRPSSGDTIMAIDLVSRDAIAILENGDRPDPTWFERSARVLAEHRELAFGGTWPRRAGETVPWHLDIAPELHPFEHGSRVTRTLVRTRPGELLVDLLDPDLGALGEIGLVWKAVAAIGPGCLLPTPLIEIVADAPPPLDADLLAFLVARYGQAFAERLSLLIGPLQDRAVGRHMEPVCHTIEDRIQSANELDGRTLLRIAARKLVRKLGLTRGRRRGCGRGMVTGAPQRPKPERR